MHTAASEAGRETSSAAEHSFARQLLAEQAALELEAARRLMDAGIAADLWDTPEGSRWALRATTLVPSGAAAAAVALFVVQLYVGGGSLG